MSASDQDADSSVPLWWILIFLLLTLGLAAAAIQFIGGSLIAGALVPQDFSCPAALRLVEQRLPRNHVLLDGVEIQRYAET